MDDWFELGIYINVSYSKLKVIELNYPHSKSRCRTEMLHTWLNTSIPSWSAVIEALHLMGMNRLAKRLAVKFI